MPYHNDDYLLPDAMKLVAGWTDWSWPNGTRDRVLKDTYGRLAFTTTHRHTDDYRERFVVCAKRGPLLSVSRRPLRYSETHDALIAIFVGEDPTMSDAVVYHPTYVRVCGERSRLDSKRADGITVWDVSRSGGVSLGEYISGRRDVPRPDSSDPRPSTLHRWGISP